MNGLGVFQYADRTVRTIIIVIARRLGISVGEEVPA